MTDQPLLKTSFQDNGIDYPVEWYEVDSFDHLLDKKVTQVYGVCYTPEEVILVVNSRGEINLPGGGIEEGETYDQTLHREILEETNSKVTSWLPIGYQIVDTPDYGKIYQLRVACRVEVAKFIKDTGGGVIANKYVQPAEVNKLIGYGEIGERIMSKAEQLKPKLLGSN